MACLDLTTADPAAVVVPFPGAAPANLDALKDQRWSRSDLPANVVSIRPPRQVVRLPDTPERALIRALGRHLPPKAYTGLTMQLRDQAAAGDLFSKAALLMVMDQA